MEEIEQDKTIIEIKADKPARISKIGTTKLIIKDETNEVYANGMTVLHTSPLEFRLHFYDVSFGDDEGPLGIVKSIVMVNPSLIREIIKALEINLKTYEDKFGKIEEPKNLEGYLAEVKNAE